MDHLIQLEARRVCARRFIGPQGGQKQIKHLNIEGENTCTHTLTQVNQCFIFTIKDARRECKKEMIRYHGSIIQLIVGTIIFIVVSK